VTASAHLQRGISLLLLVAAVAHPVSAETVELVPDDRPSWTVTNLFAPITGLFLGGPGYWYEPRRIEVRTTPPGALLDLFYVRRNFQKAYEQSEAPVTILLPSRIEATGRDTVTIRAMLDGYRQTEVNVRVRSRETQVAIELDPLPNELVAFSHASLGKRASLDFLTSEALTFRVQESKNGYSLVLTQTSGSDEAEQTLRGVRSGLIDALKPQQLGEDLVVRIALSEHARAGGVELRSRQSFDPARSVHAFSLDLVPPDGGAADVERARAALDRIRPGDVSGCAAEFDAALREQLDPAGLARALAPRGAFTDPYLRAALKRLGEVSSGGVIALSDGRTYRPDVPIELMAAAGEASRAEGYLALLRRFVAELEPGPYRRETLRGLVAPEVPPARFAAMVAGAEARERRCLTAAAR
jgi:hypothetical protein